jgi:hypothetical protein
MGGAEISPASRLSMSSRPERPSAAASTVAGSSHEIVRDRSGVVVIAASSLVGLSGPAPSESVYQTQGRVDA